MSAEDVQTLLSRDRAFTRATATANLNVPCRVADNVVGNGANFQIQMEQNCPWATDTAAWYAAGHWTSLSAWVLYGLGGLLLAVYRRSRTWTWPAAWAATIPVSSIVLGVLLYAPAQ